MDLKNKMSGMRLGVIGKPSDWLIASQADYSIIKKILGIDIIDIPFEELLNNFVRVIPAKAGIQQVPLDSCLRRNDIRGVPLTGLIDEFNFERININDKDIDDANRIYYSLKKLIGDRNLNGGTIRCFDLLIRHKTSACLALAKLNAEGIIFGCEGDVPALISMLLLGKISSNPVFMANPASIDIHKNEVLLAHCTLPLNMADHIQLNTHFETNLGVGVCGKIKTGRGTLFKINGDLSRYFVSGVDILKNTSNPNCCRTQILVKLDKPADYFFKDPLGNHHILCNGDYTEAVDAFLKSIVEPHGLKSKAPS